MVKIYLIINVPHRTDIISLLNQLITDKIIILKMTFQIYC